MESVEEEKDKKITKKVIIISGVTLLLVLVIIGAFVFLKLKGKTDHKNDNSSQMSDGGEKNPVLGPDYLPACGTKNDWYTVSPLKQEDYFAQIPLGNLNPTGHVFPTDHIYLPTVSPEDINSGVKVARDLYSPGDIWITGVSSSENKTKGVTDYDISYYPCRELEGRFGHVGSISSKLQEALKDDSNCQEYTTGDSTYRRCEYEAKIQVSAGEKIGTAGNGQSNALDIWALDARIDKLKYANPERWEKWRPTAFYVACPIDYFTEGLKNTMMARFGDFNGKKRTKEPVCGTVAVDKSGTAQGYWFTGSPDAKNGEDPYMALVPSNIETDKQLFSMGISGEGKGFKGGAYYFAPQSSGLVNRDFSQVKSDGQVYCYNTGSAPNEHFGSDEKSAILLTMPDEKTVRVEKLSQSSCGTGPWTITNYTEFAR